MAESDWAMTELRHPLKTAKGYPIAAKKKLLFCALVQSYYKQRNQTKTIDVP